MALDHTFLWLLTQSQNRGFDTYDSCVVAADTEDEARNITPDGAKFKYLAAGGFGIHSRWAFEAEAVSVEKIGVTQASRRGQVIISSFNAG